MNPDQSQAPDAQLRAVLDYPRNGANKCFRYSALFRNFFISDGAKEVADAVGAYWLFDVLASELSSRLLVDIDQGEISTLTISISVHEDASCTIKADASGLMPNYWSKEVPRTAFPKGAWDLFTIGTLEWDESTSKPVSLLCCLISER